MPRVIAAVAALATLVGGMRATSGGLLTVAVVLAAYALWPRKAKDCGGIHCGCRN